MFRRNRPVLTLLNCSGREANSVRYGTELPPVFEQVNGDGVNRKYTEQQKLQAVKDYACGNVGFEGAVGQHCTTPWHGCKHVAQRGGDVSSRIIRHWEQACDADGRVSTDSVASRALQGNRAKA